MRTTPRTVHRTDPALEADCVALLRAAPDHCLSAKVLAASRTIRAHPTNPHPTSAQLTAVHHALVHLAAAGIVTIWGHRDIHACLVAPRAQHLTRSPAGSVRPRAES